MDIVTFETAKKLKKAGFFQPHPFGPDEPIQGCFYVSETIETTSLLDGISDNPQGKTFEVKHRLISFDFDNSNTNGFNLQTELLYAPTSIDILSHPLAEGYGVSRQYDTTESGLSWVCCPTEWDSPGMVSAYHETSAAEAAALVWIELNEKK